MLSPRPARDPHRALIAALVTALPDGARLIASHATPWASVTFSGARHRLDWTLPDARDATALAETLADHSFTLRDHLVADLTATVAPDGVLAVEVLTIEDV